MDRLGLGYDVLRSVKPDLVMVSISSSGQTGPDSHFAGYAPLFGAWGGLGYLTGYRDGPPVEMRHVMDHSVGQNAALATLAALHKRRRSGQGTHVDVAAREVASSLIGEALTAASAGVTIERMGNEDYSRAPHGLYLTNAPDRWLSIVVETDKQWQALTQAMNKPELGSDKRFSTSTRRHAARHLLDKIMAQWCANCDAAQTAVMLQRLGVPAHVSWNTEDIVNDPHLQARGAIVQVTETDGKQRAAVGFPARFSKSDQPSIERGTPELGEHENYVYGELLGMGRKEYDGLVADNVIY